MAKDQAQVQDPNSNSQTSNDSVAIDDSDFADLLGMDEEPGSDDDGSDEGQDDTGDGVGEGSDTVTDQKDADANADASVDKQNFDEDSKEYWENRARLMEAQLADAYKKTPAAPEKPEEETPIEGSSFFGEWKFEDIIENEDSFKKFLGDFATKVRAVTKESILKDLPGTVTKLTAEQLETRRVVTNFYDTNKELQSVKPFVAQITNQVASEHPEWNLEEILQETAERSYKALGLKKKIEEESSGKSKKPAFVNPGRGRRGEETPQKSKLEKELEELMEL